MSYRGRQRTLSYEPLMLRSQKIMRRWPRSSPKRSAERTLRATLIANLDDATPHLLSGLDEADAPQHLAASQKPSGSSFPASAEPSVEMLAGALAEPRSNIVQSRKSLPSWLRSGGLTSRGNRGETEMLECSWRDQTSDAAHRAHKFGVSTFISQIRANLTVRKWAVPSSAVGPHKGFYGLARALG